MVEFATTEPSPFHPGEVAMQTSIGVADRVEQLGKRMVRDFMLDQHREFFAQLPFLVMGAVDPQGDVWATLLAGTPGFVQSPDPRMLALTARPDPRDPASAGLHEGSAVGLLGIEFHTRRRNRMNGRIFYQGEEGFAVRVEHSFGNCPQYIQRRSWQMARDPADGEAFPEPQELGVSDPRVAAIINEADTFFVASYADDASGRHVDASHRGGKPGFVQVNARGALIVPDFSGNRFFNTLGNFVVNPRAGMVFADFATGDLLQLTGDVDVLLAPPDLGAYEGAERLWVVHPHRVVLRRGALPLRFASLA